MKKIFSSKKIFLALLLIAVFSFVAIVQAGVSTGNGTWEWTNPTVQGNNINAASFIDATTGWVAGGGGVVMKTTDSGVNWTVQTPAAFESTPYSCQGSVIGSGCNLRGIAFVNSTTGWAVGDYGSIWKTADGGTTWTKQALPSPYTGLSTLRAVHFADASRGVIVGDGVVFFTTNGGTNWSLGSGIGGSSLYSVQMLSTSAAVAVGSNGVIYKTVNGGVNWTAKTSNTTSQLSSVTFSSSTNGYAVGGEQFGALITGRILRTTDGGETWAVNATAVPTVLTGVAIPGGDKLVTTGSGGNIRKNTVNIWTDPMDTVAAGLAQMTSGTSNILQVARFAPGSTTGYVAGGAGIVLSSTDSGTTWTKTTGDEAVSYYRGSFTDINNGWMVGENGTVSHTINGGTSWSSDNTGIAANVDLNGVDFRSPTLGFTVGYIPGDPKTGMAYKYNSGTWSSMSIPGGAGWLGTVKMSDDTHGWAVGENGVILGTSDGTSWSSKTVINADYDFNSVDSTSTTNGWVVGSAPCPSGCSPGQTIKGVILRYNGADWTTLPAVTKTNVSFFTSIDMVDALNGWVVGFGGGSGRIYRTTDGGATWAEQTSPTSKLIAGVTMLDVNNGFFVADEGRIGRYNGVAGTWSIDVSGTDVPLYNATTGITNPANYAIYAAGGNSAILKYAPIPVASPFYEKWAALSGAPGSATGVEQVVAGGKYQDFTNGRLILNDSTGLVYYVHGDIKTKYEALGGMTGPYGLPISDEFAAPGVSGAVESDFTGGKIFWGPGIGAYGVSGKIGERFSTGGGSAAFGIPTTNEYDAGGGKAQHMQNAIMTWDGNGANPAYAVVGGILAKYKAVSGPGGYGPLGPLGLATSDEGNVTGVTDARWSDFAGGRIYWGPGVGTYAMTNTPIEEAYDLAGGPGYLGLPLTDVYSADILDGKAQIMQKSIFTWSNALGAHYVRGGVMVKYQMLGGPTGYLHLIVAEEHNITGVPGSPETVRADFQAGQVFWATAIGSRTVNGGIYTKYLQWDGPTGALGLPITDEYAIALPGGGQRQRFQHGFITWGLYYGTWVDII